DADVKVRVDGAGQDSKASGIDELVGVGAGKVFRDRDDAAITDADGDVSRVFEPAQHHPAVGDDSVVAAHCFLLELPGECPGRVTRSAGAAPLHRTLPSSYR